MRRWALYFHLVSKAEWGGGDTEKHKFDPKVGLTFKKEKKEASDR